jgi:hypothetical protein
MDKEGKGIYVSNLRNPNESVPAFRGGFLAARLAAMAQQEEGPIAFDPYNKKFEMEFYSIFERKMIKSSQIWELIGLKEISPKPKWSLTCFESTIAIFLDGRLFFVSFSSETNKFEFAHEKVYDFRHFKNFDKSGKTLT